MIWKARERKLQWLNLRYFPFVAGTKESLTSLSRYLTCGSEFETGNSQTRSIIAAYLRATFRNTETKVDTRMGGRCMWHSIVSLAGL
jgi:hypothetical protein